MDEYLEYFQKLIHDPKDAEPWQFWWDKNKNHVLTSFSRQDYLRLKFRGLEGVRAILSERGLLNENCRETSRAEFGDTHCSVCGEELFWAIPGKTTPEEIVAFARETGNKKVEQTKWIHPGVYCSQGCTFAMHNYGRSVQTAFEE